MTAEDLPLERDEKLTPQEGAELLRLWDEGLCEPVPDYPEATLRKAFPCRM